MEGSIGPAAVSSGAHPRSGPCTREPTQRRITSPLCSESVVDSARRIISPCRVSGPAGPLGACRPLVPRPLILTAIDSCGPARSQHSAPGRASLCCERHHGHKEQRRGAASPGVVTTHLPPSRAADVTMSSPRAAERHTAASSVGPLEPLQPSRPHPGASRRHPSRERHDDPHQVGRARTSAPPQCLDHAPHRVCAASRAARPRPPQPPTSRVSPPLSRHVHPPPPPPPPRG